MLLERAERAGGRGPSCRLSPAASGGRLSLSAPAGPGTRRLLLFLPALAGRAEGGGEWRTRGVRPGLPRPLPPGRRQVETGRGGSSRPRRTATGGGEQPPSPGPAQPGRPRCRCPEALLWPPLPSPGPAPVRGSARCPQREVGRRRLAARGRCLPKALPCSEHILRRRGGGFSFLTSKLTWAHLTEWHTERVHCPHDKVFALLREEIFCSLIKGTVQISSFHGTEILVN